MSLEHRKERENVKRVRDFFQSLAGVPIVPFVVFDHAVVVLCGLLPEAGSQRSVPGRAGAVHPGAGETGVYAQRDPSQ